MIQSLIDIVNNPYAAEFGARIRSLPHVKNVHWFPATSDTPEREQLIEDQGIVVYWVIVERDPVVHPNKFNPGFKQTLSKTIWGNPENYQDAISLIADKVEALYARGEWPTNEAEYQGVEQSSN